MRASLSTSAVLTTMLCSASVATAQNTTFGDHIRLSASYGVQPTSSTFNGTATRTVHLETQTLATSYRLASGPVFDIGFAGRFDGQFGLGVAVSSFNKDHEGTVTGSIPHPFFFDTPRGLDGTAKGLEHKELVTHLQVAYFVPAGGRVDVMIYGGPSFFRVQQGFVSDVSYAESYPYDSVAFSAASATVETKTAVGYHAGLDVAVRLGRNVGVGALVRFSHGSIDFDLPDGGGSATIDAGGAQAAGGIRFFF